MTPPISPSVRARSAGARAAVVVVAGLVVLVVLVVLATACGPRPSLSELDRRVHRTSLAAFVDWWLHEQAAANRVSPATVRRWLDRSPRSLDSAAARHRPFDVSTDLCSSAPDRGPSFDFRLPCIRHDFAWRNLRRLDAMAGGGIDTHARREAATRRFLLDMQTTCAQRPVVQRTGCRVVARAYFAAVMAVS